METITRKKVNRDTPPVNIRLVTKRLLRYMAEYRLLVIAMFVLLFFSLAGDLVTPLVIESAINAISFTKGISVDFRALTFVSQPVLR